MSDIVVVVSSILILVCFPHLTVGQCRSAPTTPTFPDLFPSALILTATTGTVTSPNHPSNYNINEQCAWEIRGPKGSSISVTFDTFSTGTTSQLGIVTGESAFGGSANVVPTGTATPSFMNITNNVVGITWATGGGATATGWRLTYRIFPSTTVTSAVILGSNDTTAILAILAAMGALVTYGLLGVTS